jgi:hypothetical protein
MSNATKYGIRRSDKPLFAALAAYLLAYGIWIAAGSFLLFDLMIPMLLVLPGCALIALGVNQWGGGVRFSKGAFAMAVVTVLAAPLLSLWVVAKASVAV